MVGRNAQRPQPDRRIVEVAERHGGPGDSGVGYVAERGLADQGVTEPDQAQLEQALQAEYAEARADLDIEVNPAYGPDEAGVPGGTDGSMSVAVSEYAKQAGAAQPGADYVAGLSPRMLCG